MRTKRTVLNMIFSVISLMTSSILSMLFTRTVLVCLGSDYNGLNGTISQVLSVLMLFESGFTIAALVKLYKPFGDENYGEVNRILSKTKKKFLFIGLMMFSSGTVLSLIYGLFIKTDVEYAVVVAMFLFSVASTAFNFAYTYKYRLMFQVSQKEYVIYIINVAQHLISYGGMILIVSYTRNIVLARGFFLLMNIVAGLAIGLSSKRCFPKANYNKECDDVNITGTRDLLVSRIVGILYNSLTFFYMSVFVGTIQTSVYSVYNSVMTIVHSFTNVALNAPQNALGQIINTEKNKLKEALKEYEYISIFLTCVLLSTTMALYIPFIRIYIEGTSDADYMQPQIALLLVLITATQLIHIPSGRCIELSGKFKAVKTIQVITLIILAVFSTIGALAEGLIGLLLAKLTTNLVLASMEIGYAHTKIAEGTLGAFFAILFPNAVVASLISCVAYKQLFSIHMTLLGFIVAGFTVVTINVIALALLGFIVYPKIVKKILLRVKSLFKNKARVN